MNRSFLRYQIATSIVYHGVDDIFITEDNWKRCAFFFTIQQYGYFPRPSKEQFLPFGLPIWRIHTKTRRLFCSRFLLIEINILNRSPRHFLKYLLTKKIGLQTNKVDDFGSLRELFEIMLIQMKAALEVAKLYTSDFWSIVNSTGRMTFTDSSSTKRLNYIQHVSVNTGFVLINLHAFSNDLALHCKQECLNLLRIKHAFQVWKTTGNIYLVLR